jgi:hypothetical protein
MKVARFQHAAALLRDGEVLIVAGGTASAELYDPTTGTFTTTGRMSTAPWAATATLLPSGKVLVAGGCCDTNGFSSLGSAELYDPSSGTWSPTGSMQVARRWHTATLLAGGQVLVAGGYDDVPYPGNRITTSAELYDPDTGTWSLTGSLSVARYNHTATLLPDGKVLVAGGCSGSSCMSAELYDPNAGTWSATGSMTAARVFHTATLLQSGRVLVAGGCSDCMIPLGSAELYDPGTGTWTATGSMSTPRVWHTATLLADGRVLVASGLSSAAPAYTPSAELYDPTTGVWSPTGSLATARAQFTATALADGQVLAAGGAAGNLLTSSELYSPGPGPLALLSPSGLDFGSQPVTMSGAAQTVTLTNTGVTNLTASVALTGTNPADFAETDTCTGLHVAPGTACAIHVTFRPASAGTHTAVLVITDDAPTSPQSVDLSGTGVYASISLSAGFLDYGSQLVGTTGATQTVTLGNTSPVSVAVGSIVLTGTNPADFAEADGCTGVPIAPGGSCTISIAFAPTAAGSRHAQVVITDNAADSPQSISLSGMGANPPTAIATSVPLPTDTAAPIATPVPPSATSMPPTNSPTRPTSTPVPPTGTPMSPTATPSLATSTAAPASATATATQMARTAHRVLPLTLSVAHHVVRGGQTLTLGLNTGAHTLVAITVQVIRTKVVVTGKGRHRKHVTQTWVLYRVSLKGTADAHGRFTGHLRITYRPAKPTQAHVLVSVHRGRLTASRTLSLTIQPPGRHK